MTRLFNIINMRLRYYARKLLKLFGYCSCGSRLNFTRQGQGVCPDCGRRI